MNIVGVTTKAVKFSTVKRKINNYKNKLENLFSLEKRNYKKTLQKLFVNRRKYITIIKSLFLVKI